MLPSPSLGVGSLCAMDQDGMTQQNLAEESAGSEDEFLFVRKVLNSCDVEFSDDEN
jgi:hypothetical protein